MVKGLKTSQNIAVALFKTIWKNKYYFILILSLLPLLISSIQTTIQTQNPFFIPLSIGVSILDADSSIDEKITEAEENPEKIFKIKEEGIIGTTEYYISSILFWWSIIGLISLISFPYVVVYKYYRWKGQKGVQSSPSGDTTKTMFVGTLWIIFINLIIIIVKLINKTITFSFSSSDFFIQAKDIIILVLPFHGLFHLLMYLITLFA